MHPLLSGGHRLFTLLAESTHIIRLFSFSKRFNTRIAKILFQAQIKMVIILCPISLLILHMVLLLWEFGSCSCDFASNSNLSHSHFQSHYFQAPNKFQNKSLIEIIIAYLDNNL